jgi:hypothetical protein
VYFGAFSLPATVLGGGGGEDLEILSVPSQVQWQFFQPGGEDGHVHSPNNNSDHATSASCVKV